MTPLTAHLMNPAPYIVLDLETGDAPAEAVEAAIAGWKAPSNWKPETVEAKKAERATKLNGKAALLDASPILCVAFKSDAMAVIFNGMDLSAPEVPGWMVLPCGDEAGLLNALRTVLDASAAPDTVLVGHNLVGFDLPKLRNAYIRHRMQLPLSLAFDAELQPVYDTMRMIKYCSMENALEQFVSLDTVARVLGIPTPKAVITGADCPRLHRDGEFSVILTYCALDVATTERAYLLMTGQAQELA
jgi:hypothetical protein